MYGQARTLLATTVFVVKPDHETGHNSLSRDLVVFLTQPCRHHLDQLYPGFLVFFLELFRAFHFHHLRSPFLQLRLCIFKLRLGFLLLR